MRVFYLDESGIGKISKEPHLIVAGVFIHMDNQYRAISQYLRDSLHNAVPAGQPVPNCIHAVDVYHGAGEFPRAIWPKEIRFDLLDKVGAAFEKFKIPMVWGMMDRAEHAKKNPGQSPRDQLVTCYTATAFQCFIGGEWYMRSRVRTREVASIVMEQNTELQKRIKEIYRFIQNGPYEGLIDAPGRKLIPLERFIDTPTFQEKTDSSMLQLADYCAFALKRAVAKLPDYERFIKPLQAAEVDLTHLRYRENH